MAERNARFTLFALEVVGDGVGFENSADEDGRGWRKRGMVVGFDCCYFCCFPGEGFCFSSSFFFLFVGLFSSFFRFENDIL